ncbi:MAG: ribonuclease P protein component [Candidatus Staskawiczbacteria bacterium RIFCSPHIGHO2_02_FULL_43_16]|uniref:Ribonuclease P protein component n=1 Tax=Candidatus Staskawiczbacteria bacterium RIFCSPHIGHO2_01_FULL_41_41 TaxID=1802203 RepID=A0A1G2HVC7_9BACT|nr:MAG: ribonuclease P protein component [Candidatus Staskawiczbacteria bacterium RIFCSPHIGHO2_01_FULL_41_41]OGZ68949.1 MAG: ribonuclease P protein component [Candidatus Staskawiczbacteria bacterium RIFCSPHIGHO2_02_FULL_43_16]OGZ74869.1 MAG: ribonuclease P protein component [Candidatus Staskawiczbacteria bacterium RIFCSPLOWO2_01_FULL_43_17b]
MLPKQNRLTKKKDFDAVFGAGKSIKGNFLIAKVLDSNLPESRFGFIVSKKVSNKATVRNKVKRQLRSIISAATKTTPPADVVFIALPGIQKKELFELKESVDHLFKKL